VNNYTEHQEGPDGQSCELLTRIPYDRQRMIETAMYRARSNVDRLDAAFRALLWSATVKDVLTGETTDDVDRAAAEVIQPWRVRAVELYNDWFKAAYPGPKGSSGTGRRTRSGAKTAPPSETSG
jgi:hypothetical protein